MEPNCDLDTALSMMNECEHCHGSFDHEPVGPGTFCSIDCEHDHKNEAWEARAYPQW